MERPSFFESVMAPIARERHGLLAATAILVTTWSLLAAGAALAPSIGRDTALLGSFACAAFLAWVTRRGVRSGPPGVPALGLAFAAGFAGFSALVYAVATIGFAAGLPPPTSGDPASASLALWLAMLVLAPCFEETVYRARLLPALQGWIPTAPALVASSLLFALPHLEPWQILGTFMAGLLLGVAYLRSGSLAICIALHAGLNAASLVRGSGWQLAPPSSALAGAALLAALATVISARGGSGVRPLPAPRPDAAS